jgi:hypothetical protein
MSAPATVRCLIHAVTGLAATGTELASYPVGSCANIPPKFDCGSLLFAAREAGHFRPALNHDFGTSVALHSASEDSITYGGDQFGDFGTPPGARP